MSAGIMKGESSHVSQILGGWILRMAEVKPSIVKAIKKVNDANDNFLLKPPIELQAEIMAYRNKSFRCSDGKTLDLTAIERGATFQTSTGDGKKPNLSGNTRPRRRKIVAKAYQASLPGIEPKHQDLGGIYG